MKLDPEEARRFERSMEDKTEAEDKAYAGRHHKRDGHQQNGWG